VGSTLVPWPLFPAPAEQAQDQFKHRLRVRRIPVPANLAGLAWPPYFMAASPNWSHRKTFNETFNELFNKRRWEHDERSVECRWPHSQNKPLNTGWNSIK